MKYLKILFAGFLLIFLSCGHDSKGSQDIRYRDDVPVEVDETFSSSLPVMLIDTGNQVIPDEPKIDGTMKLFHTSGSRNTLTDIPVIDTLIGIETRGSSSQAFPKKNYSLETRDADGEDLNYSILDMPEESDWVLHGPFADKSLMRNHLAMNFARATGRYASRSEFLELIFYKDGKYFYRGLYLLMEKIKRDSSRVDISKLTSEHTAEPEISGGYILQVDGFSEYSFVSDSCLLKIIVEYPKEDKITEGQLSWITAYINNFENVLKSDDFTDPVTGYASCIETGSFIDYMLIRELFKDSDTYKRSTYFYKDREGLLHMGPVWDFNNSSGNYTRVQYRNPPLWIITELYGDLAGSIIGRGLDVWYTRLLEDPLFKEQLAARWQTLRAGALSNTEITTLFDSTAAAISEAADRNFEKWPVLQEYVFNSPTPFPESWEEETAALRQWLLDRAAWMDSNIDMI